MQPFLFVTDLDGTLIGNDASLKELNCLLNLSRQKHGSKVIYATGRSLFLYQELLKTNQLIIPDALITSVGTEVYTHTSKLEPDRDWFNRLAQNWHRPLIVSTISCFKALVLQPLSEQLPFKISYHLHKKDALKLLPKIRDLLESQNINNFKLIYSGDKDLDIVPVNSDKGLAVEFLREKSYSHLSRVVVCGDSGNDISLFQIKKVEGIVVGNAEANLYEWCKKHISDRFYYAKESYASGILEGLRYFGLF